MPRVGFPGGPRLEWYDRNPQATQQGYYGVIAPHADTVRATYTVPTGKKAMVTGVHGHIRRVTAATTVGLVTINFRRQATIYQVLQHVDNNVNSMKDVSMLQTTALSAGETLSESTEDLSTGGTMELRIGRHITEFDA